MLICVVDLTCCFACCFDLLWLIWFFYFSFDLVDVLCGCFVGIAGDSLVLFTMLLRSCLILIVLVCLVYLLTFALRLFLFSCLCYLPCVLLVLFCLLLGDLGC